MVGFAVNGHTHTHVYSTAEVLLGAKITDHTQGGMEREGRGGKGRRTHHCSPGKGDRFHSHMAPGSLPHSMVATPFQAAGNKAFAVKRHTGTYKLFIAHNDIMLLAMTRQNTNDSAQTHYISI